jgi:hypothetical protein
MRILPAALAVLVALSAAPLMAQTLTQAAAQEKAKRKGKTPPKPITDEDLAKAGAGKGALSLPDGATATDPAAADAKKTAGTTTGTGTPAKKEKTEDEIRAERQGEWSQKLDLARQQARVHHENIDRIQTDLNDVSGGIYTTRRTALLNMLDSENAALAKSNTDIEQLEEEGRRNGFR